VRWGGLGEEQKGGVVGGGPLESEGRGAEGPGNEWGGGGGRGWGWLRREKGDG